MSKKILVADDSPTIRKVAESLLKKQGYEVFCAEDGASALGLAKTNKPDLIFWDDSLPILDGHGVCEELKGNKELKDTPLIILLTKDEVKKEEKLAQIGADAFMVKPFNPKDILEKVQEFLNRENPNFKDEMRKGLKDELAFADESLEILETSDFVESLEAPPSGSDETEQHGFDWFVSEMKKEAEETQKIDLGTEQETKEETISPEATSFDQKDLKKKDEDKKDAKAYEIDKNQKGYEDFINELKRELKKSDGTTGPQVEKSSDQKIPPINYDEMVQKLIETISTKIAQELVKKIDPEILKQMVQDEVEKLKKEGIKAN
ncbi:MAG: response regulator [candidate division Zixibacteria bacterium]|nr:response regulator [candidate division Zixibacteria bacterium]